MNWYICIITSQDYYTMYDGIEIVKASNEKEAIEKAKKNYVDKNWEGKGNGGFGEYRSIEQVINCGKQKPK